MNDSRYRPDPAVVRRAFARAAGGYDAAAQLQREIAARMAARLDYVKISPGLVVDAGCGTGDDLRLLGARYPQARRAGFDLALPMAAAARDKTPWYRRKLAALAGREPAFLCADMGRIPLRSGCAGLLWSNLALHWVADPLAAFKEMQRVLEVGGLLMFSTVGPDTLKELRGAFAAADEGAHVHRFIDMHDLGDMLVAAGFADPVMDMEMITVTYGSVDDLMRDLRATGSHNALAGRPRGLTTPRRLARVRAAYEQLRHDGRLPATVEVVYGHAWKPQPRVTADGRAIVRLDRLHKPR